MATYLLDRKNSFKVYTLVYIFCQFLNLTNNFGQIYFMTKFVGDSIFQFSLILKDQNTSKHLIFDIFPTQILCHLEKAGSSGGKGRQNIYKNTTTQSLKYADQYLVLQFCSEMAVNLLLGLRSMETIS